MSFIQRFGGLVAISLLFAFGPASAQVVISQVYGGGNNSGATFRNDFVELFNPTGENQSLDGWSIQYTSSAGNTWGNNALNLPNVELLPGQYYLIALSGGTTNGAPLPTADLTGTINMSGTSGKVLLASTTVGFAVSCPSTDVVDLVGFGSANCFEGAAATAVLSNSTAAIRNGAGCVDTNDNGADFTVGTPTPRNTSSPTTICPGVDVPPAVSDTNPADQAINVALDSNVEIGFTEEVAIADSAAAFGIECPIGNDVAFATADSTAIAFTLNPTSNLPNGTVCTVTVTAAQVLDTDGTANAMASDFTFSFTTIPADPVVTFTQASFSQAEADTSTDNIQFTLNIIPAPTDPISFTATVTGSGPNPADASDFGVDADFGNPILLTFDGTSELPYQVSVPINGDTTIELDETFTVALNNFNGTDPLQVTSISATGTILNDDFPLAEIWEIQGTGLRSPFAPASGNNLGDRLTTQDNVVTGVASNGFTMQTPDDRAGAAPAEASRGIFVFTGSAPTVQIGDLVQVKGTVQEFFDATQLTATPTVTVIDTGTLPIPVVLDNTRPSSDPDTLNCPLTQTNFECIEGMRVSIPAGVAVTGNQRFSGDLFAEAFVTANGFRARREKGLLPSVTAPAPELPVWDGNPEVFELDADRLDAVPAATEIYGGDLFEAIGVIGYDFGNYELWPTSIDIVPAEIGRSVGPPVNEAELRIASFNVLNMCQTNCSPRVERVAQYIGDILELPDVIGLQEVWTDAGLTLLAQELNTEYGTDYVGFPGIANTDDGTGIRNAFLVRPSRVSDVVVTNLAEDETIDQCSGTPTPPLCPLHDRPPLLLTATFGGESFAVINNHTRSFLGINDPAPNGPRVRFKRFEQGKSIAKLVQRFQLGLELEAVTPGPTGTENVPLILVGDYNNFEVTDGYADVVGVIAGHYDNAENEYKLDDDGMGGTLNLVDPPLRRLVLEVDEDDRYSYTFAENLGLLLGENSRQVGSIQVLDHGLTTASADDWCPELIFGRGNADAPGEVSQNGTGAVGSSDHDGLVVRLRTDRNGVCVLGPEIFVNGFEEPND